MTALPKNVPLDWFSPDFWNNELTLRERVDIIGRDRSNLIVALPKEEFCTWEHHRKWKTLSDSDFMQQFGNVVLDEYEIPTEEEIEQLEQWEAQDELNELEEEGVEYLLGGEDNNVDAEGEI